MPDDAVSSFGGILGRVLAGATSLPTLLTGLFLGAVLFAANFAFTRMGAAALATLFNHGLIALVLARFALNGRSGEWAGTMFSQAGGTWGETAAVALRYLALSAVWLVPLVLMGVDPARTAVAVFGVAQGLGSAAIPLLAAWFFAMLLAPPVFLVAAVAADSFADLGSAAHWRSTFAGRWSDLYAVYAVYLGGVGMAMILAAPLAVIAFSQDPELGIAYAALAACFVLAVAVTLLGRLCGFFAFGAGEPLSLTPRATAAPGDAGLAVSSSPDPAAASRATAPVAAAPTLPHPLPPASAHTGAGARAAPGEADRRPPLMDAAERVEAAWKRYPTDPEGAIALLQELHDGHTPHPQVLHGLCLMHRRAQHAEQALSFARAAVPLCLERGNLVLAAEAFRAVWPASQHFDLSRDQLLAIAGALAKKGDPLGAANAYAAILRTDPGETQAVKGLLQLADARLRDDQKPDEALKMYEFLMQRCSDSPLADLVRQGVSESRQRLASWRS